MIDNLAGYNADGYENPLYGTYAYVIYSSQYGVELDRMIGQDYNFSSFRFRKQRNY